MDYSGSPFKHAYGRFVRAGHTPFIYRVIAAIVYSMVTLVIAQGIPLTVPQYAWLVPDFWSNGILGAAYLYTLITSYCLFFWRIIETKLFSYEDIENGRWDFAKKSGASIRTLLWAKYLSQIIPPMFTYLLGAAITLGSVYLIFPEFDAIPVSAACVGVGALTLLALISLESIFAAIGIRKVLLSILVFICVCGIFFGWNTWGFLKFNSESMILESIRTIYSMELPVLPAVAGVLFLLSMIVCTTVPSKRIMNYTIEKMDSTSLDRLHLDSGIEIFEKNGENYQLLYSPPTVESVKKKRK